MANEKADVVIIGAGASGLPAAIAAREKGASVIMVEMNFDIGGRAMMSFGGLYIGGGNRLQKEAGRNDTPDLVFADWSRPEMPMGRFSDRTLVRTYADNNLDLFEWLAKHGVKWEGYRGLPDRLDRARTRLNVVPWPNEVTSPSRGSGFVRPLAATARQMGVEILLQHRMTKIHREQPLSGRVIGITAIEVDDNFQNKEKTINIRASMMFGSMARALTNADSARSKSSAPPRPLKTRLTWHAPRPSYANPKPSSSSIARLKCWMAASQSLSATERKIKRANRSRPRRYSS